MLTTRYTPETDTTTTDIDWGLNFLEEEAMAVLEEVEVAGTGDAAQGGPQRADRSLEFWWLVIFFSFQLTKHSIYVYLCCRITTFGILAGFERPHARGWRCVFCWRFQGWVWRGGIFEIRGYEVRHQEVGRFEVQVARGRCLHIFL